MIVKTDAQLETHKNTYLQLMEYYEVLLGLKADPKCADINRMFYISDDPDGYINPDSKVFKSSVLVKSEIKSKVSSNTNFSYPA